MRRALAMAAAIALVATACSVPTAQVQRPVVNVQPAGAQTQMGITVTGTGEVSGTPDTLVLTLGISLSRQSVGEATRDAAELATAVIDALTSNGVGRDDISTANYSINPEYDYRNDQPQIVGYRVSNTLRVKIRDVDRAGRIIDDAVAAGGDSTIVNGVSFNIEEDSALLKAAREQAWNDAKAKAQQLADLAGLPLGPAMSISETFGGGPVPYPVYKGIAEDTVTPIEPGTQTVTVTLTVVFSLG